MLGLGGGVVVTVVAPTSTLGLEEVDVVADGVDTVSSYIQRGPTETGSVRSEQLKRD